MTTLPRPGLALTLALPLLLFLPETKGEDAPRPALSSARIDAGVDTVLAKQELKASPVCDDATFLRRVSLDVTGTIPSEGQVKAFLNDTRSDKRAKLIDELLSAPSHAEHLAAETADLLLDAFTETGNAYFYREAFQAWLTEQLARDRPWDELAAELIASEGKTDDHPALIYTLDHGRASPADLAGNSARHFLGVRVDCARCHDHPFDSWKQEDFHGLAAYYARMRVRPIPGMQGLFRINEAPVGDHRSSMSSGERQTFSPRPLSLPADDGAVRALRPGPTPEGVTKTSRRAELARWVCSPDNPWFARAAVNRVWARLFGAGLVEPVDDLSAAADSAHGPLLDALARDFVTSGYSLRALHAAILRSETYQRASTPVKGQQASEARAGFATAAVRPLGPRQVVNALLRAAGRDRPRQGEPRYLHAALQKRLRAEIRQVLGSTRDGERPSANGVTTAQGLLFLNGRGPTALVRGKVLKEILAQERLPVLRVRALYLRTLNRQPTAAERKVALKHLRRHKGDLERAGYEDLMWALLSSSEFLTNH